MSDISNQLHGKLKVVSSGVPLQTGYNGQTGVAQQAPMLSSFRLFRFTSGKGRMKLGSTR
jgi:hypothetical protein